MDTPTRVLLPATCAGEPEVPSALTLDLTNLSHADIQLSALLPHLARLDDNQLIRLAADARRLETCAFRLRGACVAELRRRIRTRLSGGRGRRDISGIGIKAQLAHLAAEIGISPTTLKIDARIHETFFADAEGTADQETGFAREPSFLAREFYSIALSAPDPVAALRHAQERCAATTVYSREGFRRDVLALKQAKQPTLVTSDNSAPIAATPKPVLALHIKITPEAQAVLDELTNRLGQSPEIIVAEALLAYHKALTASPITTTPTAIVTLTTKRERRANGTSEAQMQPSLLSPSLFGEH